MSRSSSLAAAGLATLALLGSAAPTVAQERDPSPGGPAAGRLTWMVTVGALLPVAWDEAERLHPERFASPGAFGVPHAGAGVHPPLHVQLRSTTRWGSVDMSGAFARAIPAPDGGRAGPVAGTLLVHTPGVRLGPVRADALLGLTHDAAVRDQQWTETSGTIRAWIGTEERGLWSGLTSRRAFDAPTALQSLIGAWVGTERYTLDALVQQTSARRLAFVTGDSGQTSPGGCQVVHDPARPEQQYRSLCWHPLGATDATLRLTARVGLVQVQLDGGGRVQSRGPLVAPHERWIAGRVIGAVRPGLAVVVDAGQRPSDVVRGTPRYTNVALGLRFSGRSPARGAALPIPLQSAPPYATVVVEPVAVDGLGRLRIRHPAHSAVNIRADFTAWETQPLSREPDGSWVAVLPIAAGVHTILVQADGGAWLAPPGLPTRDDGFGGVVGVLVVGAAGASGG